MATTPINTDLNLIDDEEECMVNIYLKGGGTHLCKLSEAWEWSRQNPDKVETRTHKPRRPQYD